MALSISVVTPSLNQSAYLERAISSVLAQDVPRLEYLVFDGGSADETLRILRSYESRLRWISERDEGQAHAVNKGLCASSGEVIGWLNSDDVYYSGALSAVCEFFETHPELDVVYGDAQHIDEGDRPLGLYRTEPWDPRRLQQVCYLCQPAVFFRRRVVDRYGLLDERLHYCLDYEYWLRLGLGGAKFAHVGRLLAGSRWHQRTKTARSRLETYRETNDMLRRTIGAVPDSWIFNYAHVAVEEGGYSRERPLRFALAIAVVSCSAALHWNRRVPPSLLKTMVRWAAGHARARLRGQPSVPGSLRR